MDKNTEARSLVVNVGRFSIPSEFLAFVSRASNEDERFGDFGVTLGDGRIVDAQKLLRCYTMVNGLPVGLGEQNTDSSFLDDPHNYEALKASLGGKCPIECVKEVMESCLTDVEPDTTASQPVNPESGAG